MPGRFFISAVMLAIFLLEVLEPSSLFVREAELVSKTAYLSANNVVVAHLHETVSRQKPQRTQKHRSTARNGTYFVPWDEAHHPIHNRMLPVSHSATPQRTLRVALSRPHEHTQLVAVFDIERFFSPTWRCRPFFQKTRHSFDPSASGVAQQSFIRLLI